ncbi:EAL domain-containing protein [Neobacillus muris]|uniref:EAL domain-containing protein n=1 Tax=Neobacillus muris TaxID=2941334 RepID=UPI00203A9CC1|nr:EAL domain-containing protein [Neobacillus muris]
MSIKKKLPLIFCLIVFFILVVNNAIHYVRSKSQLLKYNNQEISIIIKEVSLEVENTRNGALFVEDILARDLRTAAIAAKQFLPADYHDVTNEQLKQLAKETGVAHITLLAKTEDDIIGVKSSDPEEINMGTKDWGYWFDAYQQLFQLTPVSVGEGLTLPHYWSGPIEVASSNPDHIDKWGYYYDGTTNYIIDPYFRDKVLEYEKKFGPMKIIEDFTSQREILELSVFNPQKFGKKKEVVHLNGNTYTRISAEPIWYGTYNYTNSNQDASYIAKAIQTKKQQSYIADLNNKSVMKTFVPVFPANQEPYVIGLVYNYGLIKQELAQELKEHILLSIAIMIIVLIISFVFSQSITKPIGYIVDQVNDIAKGNFGKKLVVKRKDELGRLADNVNALSSDLQNYVNDIEQSRKVIEYQAYHDSLTGLTNRRFFHERLDSMINGRTPKKERLSIIFIDIDRFKQVNDTFGHNKGDEILKVIADRLRECFPDSNHPLITRQGGDEFLLLFIQYSLEETKAAAEQIINKLRHPYCIGGNEIFLGASCGISLYPEHNQDLDTLISYADMAMYEAKKAGGNRAVVYSNQLLKANLKRTQIESRLRKALEFKKLEVFFQPLMNAASQSIYGAEALIRWNDEELGLVSPEIFIPIAEEAGLIQPLWQFVMKQACRQVSQWNKGLTRPLTVSVNFSARQFEDAGLMVQQVKEILSECQLSPHQFEIEITESILMNYSKEILESLSTFQALGISISIDDFGTGFSSLSYLKNLPISTLKIDKSFIQDIQENLANSEIVEAIINLAKSLRLNVIAEGVEKEHQKEFLLSKNCWQMQGYLFSKPLNKDEFEEFLKKG